MNSVGFSINQHPAEPLFSEVGEIPIKSIILLKDDHCLQKLIQTFGSYIFLSVPVLKFNKKK